MRNGYKEKKCHNIREKLLGFLDRKDKWLPHLLPSPQKKIFRNEFVRLQGNMTRVLMPARQAFLPLSCLPSARPPLRFFIFHLLSSFLKNNCAHIKFLLSALCYLLCSTWLFFHFISFSFLNIIHGALWVFSTLSIPFFFYITSIWECFSSVSSINFLCFAQLESKGLQWLKKVNENLSGNGLHNFEWLGVKPVWGSLGKIREKFKSVILVHLPLSFWTKT